MLIFSRSKPIVILLGLLLLFEQGCSWDSAVFSSNAIPTPRAVGTQLPTYVAQILETKTHVFGMTPATTQAIQLPKFTELILETPTSNFVITETVTQTAQPPTIYYSGRFSLVADNIDLSRSTFDFDSNKAQSTTSQKNDIAFGLTDSHLYPILVLGPSFGATAGYLNINNGKFNYEDCLSSVNFGKGGIPVSSVNSYYCWRTNEGRMVEFVIDKIEKLDETYRIEINYLVWNDGK
jgi:hypothetical protein